MNFFEWFKVILIGIVEGITEWLPISSTGHMMLVQEFLPFKAEEIFTEGFVNMFNVVIQLGAIMAVVTIFFNKLNPFCASKSPKQKRNTIRLWMKVIVGCIPAAVIGLLFDDLLEKYLYNSVVVAAMLVIYGVAFILVERWNKKREPSIEKFSQLDYKTVLIIGAFQVLALIPGTSRSGATILGAMIFGCSRYIAAEYTFYLAIPVMFGASFLKVIKYGFAWSSTQVLVILVAMLVAYVVSVLAIKFLMGYIKKNDFQAFGWYRIVLGVLVLLTFLI